MFKKSFHRYVENSVVYRHLRDYFNNPVKRWMISNGKIYSVMNSHGDCVSHALTSIDVELFRIYCLILTDLRYYYDNDWSSFPLAYLDNVFGARVCAVAPYFRWGL